MPKQVRQLVKATAGRIGNVARSGRSFCQRFVAGLRRGSKKAKKGAGAARTEMEPAPLQHLVPKEDNSTVTSVPAAPKRIKEALEPRSVSGSPCPRQKQVP